MRVTISSDESYATYVYEFETDADFPSYYLPLEIPDELWQEYLAAQAAFDTIRRTIIETFGVSQPDPEYFEKRESYFTDRSAAATPSDIESAWAEYEAEGE